MIAGQLHPSERRTSHTTAGSQELSHRVRISLVESLIGQSRTVIAIHGGVNGAW